MARRPSASSRLSAGHLGDVEFYRLVQPVDRIVHARHLGDGSSVVGHQRRHALAQHGLGEVSHVQHFACRAGERH